MAGSLALDAADKSLREEVRRIYTAMAKGQPIKEGERDLGCFPGTEKHLWAVTSPLHVAYTPARWQWPASLHEMSSRGAWPIL